jgi:sarcosine oxidase subunit delta
MFVIQCPHCAEAREEEEFGYAGEAFVARPSAPENESEEGWGDYLFMKRNPKGWHWEMWGHASGCRKFFVVKRNTANHTIAGTWTLSDARAKFDEEMASA